MSFYFLIFFKDLFTLGIRVLYLHLYLPEEGIGSPSRRITFLFSSQLSSETPLHIFLYLVHNAVL